MVNNIVSETFKRCRQFISDIFGHSEDSEYTKYLNKRLDVWESDVRASFNIGPYAIEHISLENEEHPSSFEDLTADRIRKELDSIESFGNEINCSDWEFRCSSEENLATIKEDLNKYWRKILEEKDSTLKCELIEKAMKDLILEMEAKQLEEEAFMSNLQVFGRGVDSSFGPIS